MSIDVDRSLLRRGNKFGGKADHLAQEIGVRGLLQKAAHAHHDVGYWQVFRSGLDSQLEPNRKPLATTAPPIPSYRAMKGADEIGDDTAKLHHGRGRDLAS